MVVFAYMLSWRGWHRGGWLDLLVNVYNNNNSLLESAYCSPVMVHCATFLLNFQGYMLLKISYSQQKSQQYMYGFLVQISGRIVESAECPLSLSTHSWIFSMFYIPHSLSLLSSFLLIIILLFLPLILLYYLSFLSSSLFPFLFSSFCAFFIIWYFFLIIPCFLRHLIFLSHHSASRLFFSFLFFSLLTFPLLFFLVTNLPE